MNKNRKLLKAAAAMLAVTLASSPVMAAGTNYDAAVGGVKTTEFTKYVTMDKDAILPSIDFTFKVTAGTPKTYSVSGKTFEVLAGVEPDAVTMEAVDAAEDFHIGFDKDDVTKEDDNAMIKGFSSSTQKYVEKNGTLNFENVHFKEPGVYRYILTESGNNQSVFNDEAASRILDVYVVNDDSAGGKKLKIGGYVLHSSEDDLPMGDNYGTKNTDPAGKSQGFTNDYKTVDLTFRKEVSGNQASKDKYFKFTVTFSGGYANDEVKVILDNADSTVAKNDATLDDYEGKTNPTKITFDQDGSATETFYLQHGQEIKICDLPTDVDYSVTEVTEDYKSASKGVSGYEDEAIGRTDVETKTELKTSYLNTRDGLIPTGVAVAVAPFAGLTLLACAGLIVTRRRRRA